MANDFDWQKTYPAIVSRTLDPSNKSLVTVVALHDKQITDADINLIQDLQDYKRRRLLNDQTTSGCLTYAPFQFNPVVPNTFYVPSFDLLFNGEVVTIQGNNSSALTLNAVTTPPPVVWASVLDGEDARIYVAFVEVWYQPLNPQTGQGYYTDPATGLRYFFPYGGTNPAATNANLPQFLDDSIDPFQGLFTTERAQVQWRINVQRVALTYDFTKYQFGLDPGAIPTEIVYAQASQAAPLNSSAIYQFQNMGSINGDAGVWRAGDGNIFNSLGTMDGYSYAFPLAVIFQKNYGIYDVTANPFGCAASVPPYPLSAGRTNGLLSSGISGRFDSRLADQIFTDNVADTRSTVNLSGWDMDALCRYGFSDLVQGKTQLAIARGESPGNKAEALGSLLNYNISVTPAGKVIGNTFSAGSWDGFANGFSSDQRTYTTTFVITTNNKTLGNNGQPWVSGPTGDAFTVILPTGSQATIQTIDVTALVTQQSGALAPASLLQGQVLITGLGSTAVTVQLIKPLAGTAFDPGANNIYATVGVQYPTGTGRDLRHIPSSVDGGVLFDNVSGITMPVYGVSEYQTQSTQPALQANAVFAVNPEYSNVVLGTKIWLALSASSPTQASPGGVNWPGVQSSIGQNPITTFIINTKAINQSVNGLYVTKAWDSQTLNLYPISSRTMNAHTHVLTVQGTVDPASTLIVSFLAQNTAQLAYNAPVRGVTEIEETVLMGNYTIDSNYPMDPRVSVQSVVYNGISQNTTTTVLAANKCSIKGISGDDVNRLIWVSDGTGTLNAVVVQSVAFTNGIVTIVVPGNLASANFFFAGSILPAFDPLSQLLLGIHYIPYQGEGAANRDYEFLHAEDNALVTTNGTGSAPIVGLKDVYPYNRELPIAVTLPSQINWNDATLANAPLASFFDSNYVAMRVNNVEHTFLAPLHTNDFIPPVNKDIRKTVRFLTTGGRGFATAVPHLGFAIATPTPRAVLGLNLQSTQAPITLFVNNSSGNDSNDGLTSQTAKFSILAAVVELPPVLRHICTIQIMDTGTPYVISSIAASSGLQQIAIGDGVSQSLFAFALANLSRVVQEEGRLVISIQAGSTNQVVVDATGFTGTGNGPTHAFYIDTSRVIFNGIQFKGFQDAAIKAKNADVQYVNCSWLDCLQAGSYEEACGVVIDGGSITLPNSGFGHIATGGTTVTATSVNLAVDAFAVPNPFFTVERGSTINLQTHGTGSLEETNVTASAVVVQVEFNSSIVVTADFQTAGSAILEANSVLGRSVVTSPFLGGVTVDNSSSIVTQF